MAALSVRMSRAPIIFAGSCTGQWLGFVRDACLEMLPGTRLWSTETAEIGYVERDEKKRDMAMARPGNGNRQSGVQRRRLAHCAGLCLAVFLVWGLGGIDAARACAFHLYKPAKTVIDRVIETDHLVVARANPENEFVYQVVETLRGNGSHATIAQLVDTRTRRKLAANPQDGVLFAFDTATGQWRLIAYLTPQYRSVIDRVLSGMGTWQGAYDPARFAIFEALQDHPEPALRELALREIDKAPYELLREIDLRMPVDSLLAGLRTLQDYPYKSIRILLLGLSGDDAARREIHAFFDRVADQDLAQHLGAFATALVEIDGTAGIALLEGKLLSDPRQPLDKLEQVVEALAIHNGVGSHETQQDIAAALGRLLRMRPEAAPLMARQFGSRQDWTLAGQLAPIVAQRRLSKWADLMVAVYVAQAKAATASGSKAQGG